ncbi:MAG TPA: class I SAM-dependent methyltransferase [Candidatus Acidoferrum sp.]|nr:class I SAM-dependent methyltransferase [Candidatus Acidoferrum sp.]
MRTNTPSPTLPQKGRDQAKRRLWLPEMEGPMARWYDRQRGTPSQIKAYREQAAQLTAGLPQGARVLEVAPGPGYLAIEIARPGRFQVTGLDISQTFVEIGGAHARQAGVSVDFRHGDAAAMPFESDTFDLIVCQAAFKNFRQPVSALNEMYRVLRGGGTAVTQDLRKDASRADIQQEIRNQGLSGIRGLITSQILGGLRRRAYTPSAIRQLVAESAFHAGDIKVIGIGMEVRLTK